MAKGIQPGTVSGATAALHAARAWQGVGPGVNSPAVGSWFDTSGNANHGVLTGFAYEPGYRPRTNTEADKAVWHDFSGYGNNGALSGFAWTAASGWATVPDRLVFDAASGDYLSVPDSASLRPGAADFSFEITLNFPLTIGVGWMGVAGKGINTSALLGAWGFQAVGTDVNTVQFADVYAAGSWNCSAPFGTLAAGMRQLMVTRTSGVYRRYIDGSLYSTPVTPANLADLIHANPMRFATDNLARFVGTSMCLTRLYTGLGLSAAQVAQNYATGVTGENYVRAGLMLDLAAHRAVRGSGWAGSP